MSIGNEQGVNGDGHVCIISFTYYIHEASEKSDCISYINIHTLYTLCVCARIVCVEGGALQDVCDRLNPNPLFLASVRACERRGGTSSFGLALHSILSGFSYAAPPAPAQPGTPCLAAPTALPSLAHPAFAGL